MSEQALQVWTRETAWRQGHALPREAAMHFGLTNAVDAEATCVIVVTHDCDLANDNLEAEPHVEVIVGRVVEKVNGNFTWAKAPRTLHYQVEREGAAAFVELVATAKTQLRKCDLAHFLPDLSIRTGGAAIAVLRSWLSARYNRAAFPDEFVTRMRETKADAKLAKALETYGKNISFTYFDLDAGLCVERAEGDPYELKIVLVFNPGHDPDEAADAADEAANAVQSAVAQRLAVAEKSIRLRDCFAVSEDDIRVSQARILSLWRLEYMTHRAEDEQIGPLVT